MPERKDPKTKKRHTSEGGGGGSHPITILERCKSVTLTGYIMFINGIHLINAISIHIKFMTAEHIANSDLSTLQESIRQVKQVYMQRGFKLTNILMDGQFGCIRGNLVELHINLNIFSNDEHVGEIDQLNHTVKERDRGVYNMLPFNKLPGRMIIELVALVIFWIKVLPTSPSVGGNLSTHQITTSLTINDMKHCRPQFSTYAQFHKSHDNTMQERTTGAISLWPTGNAQGAYFFMSLTTGQILNRQSFTPLPLPQDVINSVHHLVRRNPKGLDIRNRDQHLFLEPEDGANNDDDDST